MPTYERLIQFEREHSALDFKATVYSTRQHEALVKDIVSLANAEVSGARHIVMGVKEYPDGRRDLLGVDPATLPDQAAYQQLVRENVEPSLDISLIPETIDGKTYGIILVGGCSDPPYLMRKDFGDLAKGDGWIRIGTHQPRLTRPDFERIYATKLLSRGFSGDIGIRFRGAPEGGTLVVHATDPELLPSARAKRRIEDILASREGEDYTWRGLSIRVPFQSTPYEQRSTEELRECLATVAETYAEDDQYALFEEYGVRVNAELTNLGGEHLVNCLLELRFPTNLGVLVADRVFDEPVYNGFGSPLHLSLPTPSYPEVEEVDGVAVVTAQVGDLRHQRTTQAFGTDLRVAFGSGTVGREFAIEARLHGSNLSNPINRTLTIRVEPPAPNDQTTE